MPLKRESSTHGGPVLVLRDWSLVAGILSLTLLAGCEASSARENRAASGDEAQRGSESSERPSAEVAAVAAVAATQTPARAVASMPGTTPSALPATESAARVASNTTQTAGVVFESSWSSATGSSREAVTDGGRWPVLACGPVFDRVLSVVAGAPLDFAETANVLKVRMAGENCGMLQRENVVPASTTHWGRFWIRNDEHGNKNDHPVAYYNVHPDAPIQAVPFVRYGNNLPAGQWQAGVYGDAKYPTNRWYSPPLMNGVWYRYEWEMRYLSSTTFQIWPRIYSATGQLLYSAANYTHEGGGLSLQEFWGRGTSQTLGDRNPRPDLARHFGLGNEGPRGATDSGGSWYYAKFALSTSGWIGR